MIDGDYLNTCGVFRHLGIEVAEPGLVEGTVRVYYYIDWDQEDVKDTIVKPTFSRIEVDD